MTDTSTARGAGVEHVGEQAVQRKAGEGGPGWGSPMFTAEIPAGFGRFMAEQHLAAISGVDADGAHWCSLLTGGPGFIRTLDQRTISLPAPADGDPLAAAFDTEADIGMVVMSPETARRVRVNGRATREGDRLVLRTEQVLGNCPKYLQIREVVATELDRAPGRAIRSDQLTAEQIDLVRGADTFFIGSRSPAHGADASHRGGNPGFLAAGPSTVSWPDYYGNSFYMTLGNIELNPAAGLVFLDWASGSTLQLTGRCRVDWSGRRASAKPGALRTVDFDVQSVVHTEHASPLRWDLRGYSRFNPPAAPR